MIWFYCVTRLLGIFGNMLSVSLSKHFIQSMYTYYFLTLTSFCDNSRALSIVSHFVVVVVVSVAVLILVLFTQCIHIWENLVSCDIDSLMFHLELWSTECYCMWVLPGYNFYARFFFWSSLRLLQVDEVRFQMLHFWEIVAYIDSRECKFDQCLPVFWCLFSFENVHIFCFILCMLRLVLAPLFTSRLLLVVFEMCLACISTLACWIRFTLAKKTRHDFWV